MSKTIKQIIWDRIQKLNVAQLKEGKAPYKPFLILLALANIQKGRLIAFADIEKPLRQLCEEFGPPRKAYYPEMPFWHLQSDNLWEVKNKDKITITTRIHKSTLVKNNAIGGFPEDMYTVLKQDQKFLADITTYILDNYFPQSIHDDILLSVGLTLEEKKHSSIFRSNVVEAYEHRCAVCGFDGKLGISDFALEAAHIKWRAYGGSNEVQNGMALCVLHHKSFDRGVFTIDDNLTILVSAKLYGQSWINEMFLAYKNKQIREPHSSSLLPDLKYLAWHRKHVFKQPARE